MFYLFNLISIYFFNFSIINILLNFLVNNTIFEQSPSYSLQLLCNSVNSTLNISNCNFIENEFDVYIEFIGSISIFNNKFTNTSQSSIQMNGNPYYLSIDSNQFSNHNGGIFHFCSNCIRPNSNLNNIYYFINNIIKNCDNIQSTLFYANISRYFFSY